MCMGYNMRFEVNHFNMMYWLWMIIDSVCLLIYKQKCDYYKYVLNIEIFKSFWWFFLIRDSLARLLPGDFLFEEFLLGKNVGLQATIVEDFLFLEIAYVYFILLVFYQVFYFEIVPL